MLPAGSAAPDNFSQNSEISGMTQVKTPQDPEYWCVSDDKTEIQVFSITADGKLTLLREIDPFSGDEAKRPKFPDFEALAVVDNAYGNPQTVIISSEPKYDKETKALLAPQTFYSLDLSDGSVTTYSLPLELEGKNGIEAITVIDLPDGEKAIVAITEDPQGLTHQVLTLRLPSITNPNTKLTLLNQAEIDLSEVPAAFGIDNPEEKVIPQIKEVFAGPDGDLKFLVGLFNKDSDNPKNASIVYSLSLEGEANNGKTAETAPKLVIHDEGFAPKEGFFPGVPTIVNPWSDNYEAAVYGPDWVLNLISDNNSDPKQDQNHLWVNDAPQAPRAPSEALVSAYVL